MEREILIEMYEARWNREQQRKVDAHRRAMRRERAWERWRGRLFWGSAILIGVSLTGLAAVMVYGF